jgi:hypothetical protein
MRAQLRAPRFARALALALPLGLGLAGAPASAAPPTLAETLKGDAKAAYDGGKLLFDDKDYEGAEAKFRAAYRASNDGRLLWNIATCERELRHYARTSALIEQFLDAAPALVSPEFIAQARKTLTALREFYSPLILAVKPDGTHVLIDGDDAGAAPFVKPVPVDLGKHTVRAEHDGFTPFQTVIDVAGQADVKLSISLVEISTTAQLAIVVSDPADTVTLDDEVKGVGGWHGDVTAGPHRIKVTAPGKKPYVAEIEVLARDHRTVDVTLESEHGPLIWPWITGGAAVVAGAVVATAFLLKPANTLSAPPGGAAAPTIQLSSFRGLTLR